MFSFMQIRFKARGTQGSPLLYIPARESESEIKADSNINRRNTGPSNVKVFFREPDRREDRHIFFLNKNATSAERGIVGKA